MRIAMLMRDTGLFESIRKVFDEDGGWTFERFDDETRLLGFLARTEVDLAVLHAGHEFAPLNALLAWRNCHCLDTLPVIVMGQHLGPACMMAAFDAGANDIVAGPQSPRELLARAKQVIKRCTRRDNGADRLAFAPFMLDRSASTVSRDGTPIALTSREFAIAWLFFCNPGKLLTRSQIAHTIWGKELDIVGRTLEQHIYKLRHKLQLGSGNASLQLSTVYSLGYKLVSTPADAGQPTNELRRAA
jgi:DNA-binding response OmpR family regulator